MSRCASYWRVLCPGSLLLLVLVIKYTEIQDKTFGNPFALLNAAEDTVDISAICAKGDSFCRLPVYFPVHQSPSEKGSTRKGKNLLSFRCLFEKERICSHGEPFSERSKFFPFRVDSGSKFFPFRVDPFSERSKSVPFRVDPFSEGRRIYFDNVVSL